MEEQTLESRWRRQRPSVGLKAGAQQRCSQPALHPLLRSCHPLETTALYGAKVSLHPFRL